MCTINNSIEEKCKGHEALQDWVVEHICFLIEHFYNNIKRTSRLLLYIYYVNYWKKKSINKCITENVNQRLKTPKWYSDAINRRRTDNTVDKCEM